MNKSTLYILSIVSVLYLGYLNCGYASTINQPTIPKALPNISAGPTSFVSLPGGVNFSFYDPIVAAVNITRSIPNLVARHGNFTLLQAILLKAVGAIFTGLGIILLEAFELKKQKNHETHDVKILSHHGAPSSNSYSAPPSPPSNSYSAPPSPPSNSYSAQSSPPSISYSAQSSPPSNSYNAPLPISYGVSQSS